MKLPALPTFGFYQRLSLRERSLVLLVAGTVFILANLFVLRGLAASFRELSAQRRQKAFAADTLRLYVREKPRWTDRMRWLKEKQPPLANRDVAAVKLQDQIKTFADQQKIILSNQQILPAPSAMTAPAPADYQALTVQVDAKGDWLGVVHFLAAVQKPENFIAFESASLRNDPADPKMMKGQFRVSKWFSPPR